MNKIAKALKWGASALRVAKMCVVAGNWLKIASDKPLYLGKGARVILDEGASLSIGAGVYLSPECFVQVTKGATLVLEDGVYMNEGCRVTAVQSALIGANTLFGPNVQIYDRDHEFDCRGVSSKLTYAPVSIGQHCCLCANAVVKRGSRLRAALSSRRTLLSRATLPSRARCTPVRPLDWYRDTTRKPS